MFEKYINDKNIFFLLNKKKKKVIEEMIETAYNNNSNIDQNDLKEKIFQREKIMSTGLGLGLGFPHLRYKGIDKPVIIIGIQVDGIKDYESIDKSLIKIVILILVGENEHKLYLQILSSITSFLKREDNIKKILNLKNTKKIYDFFTKHKEK